MLNLNSASSTTAIDVNGGVVNFAGGLTSPSSVTSISLTSGGTLSFKNGVGQPISNLTSLTFGAGTLELDAGDTATDTLSLLSPNIATTSGLINLLINDVDLSNLTTYDLILAPGGGLTAGGGTYGLSLAGYTGSTLSVSDTFVRLNTGTLVTSDVYWNGGTSPATTAWNTIDALTNTNFSSDAAGLIRLLRIFLVRDRSLFQADNITGGAALTTTLEQPFKINALQFRPSTFQQTLRYP